MLTTASIFSQISQKKFSKEISLVTDNDLYTSLINDRYYTSGIFFSYRTVSKKINPKLDKKIFEWQISHEMFTPYKAIIRTIEEHDRPFAANIYASFGFINSYKNERLLSSSIQVGTLGKKAFGKELQDFIHNLYGFQKAIGWRYQIKNALGVNLNLTYVKQLKKSKSNYFDISAINKLNIGTVYTNIASGLYSRIGLKPLQKLANSIAFKTNINSSNTVYVREVESFIFIKPMLNYVLYDATIQGSFLNTTSKITGNLVPLVFSIKAGIRFTANRFNFGYAFNYNTNKSKHLRYNNGQTYGTITINYLLK